MFQTYFNELQKDYLADRESSELSYRTCFQNLLNSFEREVIKRSLTIKHEPTKQKDKGRPDYKVTTGEQLTIGLIETKKIGEDLKKILETKQLANYKQLSDNIIVTDYLNFFLIKKGEPVFNTALFAEYNLQNKKYKLEQTRIEELTKLFKLFFESEPEPIFKAQDLALKLSDKACFLKEYANLDLQNDPDESNLLYGLFQGFKESIIHQIDEKDFADIYAQTITYSLFLATLNCDDPKTQLNKFTAYSLLPSSFPLIKELFHRLDDFPSDIVWAIDEILSILKVTDIGSIKKEFSEYRHREQGFNDPFIYFYEDFLKHYDKSKRELRGVYYTPEPVVSFIVRSVESILKEKFGIQDGFINKDVTLLDFAAGTGTFLLNCFKQAIEQAQKLGDKSFVNKILNEQVIGNYYGFELLVAPYVIAHLKISEYLKEQGYTIDKGKRLNILLTNTLSKEEPKSIPGLPSISKEGRLAGETKEKPLLVILGNPPYSVSSQNKTGYVAEELMERYKTAVRTEKNIQPLSDDYIKFIRFAHAKMEKVERGVVAVITNNSFIDGLIHRGMRQELMKDFDEIYILNLHGNARRAEKSPEGGKDENVFDIMQGVSISIFVKKGVRNDNECVVKYFDLYGVRQAKYDFLFNNDIKSVEWKELKPEGGNYFFSVKNFDDIVNYEKGYKIDDIFSIYSNGVKTHRDNFVIDFNKDKLQSRIKHYYSLSEENIKQLYCLHDTRDWNIKDSLDKGGYDENETKYYLYRPFDIRFIQYDLNLLERGTNRYSVMKNLFDNNYALIAPRICEVQSFHHIFITNNICDVNSIASAGKFGGGSIFPLYIFENINNNFLFQEESKQANFTPDFKQYIKTKYRDTYTPEQILGYIYAVLHSPTYRTKYIEFLKIDFPRVHFTDDEELFRELSAVGFELIEHHLLKKSYAENICRINGSGDNFKVEKVAFEKIDPTNDSEAKFFERAAGESLGRVWINKERYFEPVPESIWNFYIGGYQVLDKWLKERKKHEITLSSEDVQHFMKVVNVLDYTITAMQKIDDLTKEWI